MQYLLDTNTISFYLQRVPSVLQRLKEVSHDEVCVSAITTMEIEYGFSLEPHSRARYGVQYEQLLEEIAIVDFTAADALIAGKIRAELEERGESIGDLDEMLAATAIVQDLTMVTDNFKHFTRVSGLRLENWKTA
jgi:tRNA(fMet)-specific endonuclease VapC